jgi:hypothetical protein
MLGQRIRCQACQAIYQHLRKEIDIIDINYGPESAVECSIVYYLELEWYFHLDTVVQNDFTVPKELVLTAHRLTSVPT